MSEENVPEVSEDAVEVSVQELMVNGMVVDELDDMAEDEMLEEIRRRQNILVNQQRNTMGKILFFAVCGGIFALFYFLRSVGIV